MSEAIKDGGPAFPLAMKIKDIPLGMLVPCSKCGEKFPMSAHMKAKRGRKCPSCESKAAVDWARRNKEKKRASNNRYHKKISSQRKQATQAYRNRYPEKRLAHQAVQTAIRNGSLTRMPCETCGCLNAVAHHDDYSKPLDVRWLCHTHHMELHAMLSAREKGTT